MSLSVVQAFQESVSKLDPSSPHHVPQLIDVLLTSSRAAGASDVHLRPAPDGVHVSWRIDGVLQTMATWPAAIAPNLVARLKVLANLLTYRTDIPQEGRIRGEAGEVEMRLSSFPTIHGESAVVRLFAGTGRLLRVNDLCLPEDARENLLRLLENTSGAILVTGPAGAGKTTTAYACLRELTARSAGTMSLVSIEDPVEVVVEGVAQSQVNPGAGFDLATGLRSVLRQDPEVILVGEIRDPPTADGAFGASLTGHLVLSTFHAGSATGALSRLADMGIEPYVLRSGLLAIVNQRLVRRLCECSIESSDPHARLDIPAQTFRVPKGCERCAGTGYRGRLVLVEMLVPDASAVGRAILAREDAPHIEELAIQQGMISRWERARRAVEEGLTSPAEVRRVLGFGAWPDAAGASTV